MSKQCCCNHDRKLKDIICCIERKLNKLSNESEAYNLTGCIFCGDEEFDIVFENNYSEAPSVVVSIVRSEPSLSATNSIDANIIVHKHSLSTSGVTIIGKNCSMIQTYKGLPSSPSLAQSDEGIPSILGRDHSKFELRYYESTDQRGTSFKEFFIDDLAGRTSVTLDHKYIKNVPGFAYIAYDTAFDAWNVWYVAGSDGLPNCLDTYSTITIPYSVFKPSLVEEASGIPSVVYQVINSNSNENDYTYYHNATQEKNTPVVMVTISNGSILLSSSCILVQDNPSLCYQDGSIKFLRSNNATGSSWAAPITVKVVTTLETDPSIAIINGKPAISYLDNNVLLYVRSTMADGSDWSDASQILDTSFEAAPFTDTVSLIVLNGKPAVVYSKSGATYIVKSLDINGDAWDTTVIKIVDRVDSNHTSNNAGAIVLTGQMSDQVAVVTGGKNNTNSRFNISDDSVTYPVQVQAVNN